MANQLIADGGSPLLIDGTAKPALYYDVIQNAGIGAALIGKLTAAGTGTQVNTGSGHAVIGALTASGSALAPGTNTGAGAARIGALTAFGTGGPSSTGIVGVGAAVIGALTAAGTGILVTTTSGSYNFGPAISELVLEAFERCGLRATALTLEWMASARRSLNLVLSSWANRGINLWKVDQVTQPLTQGQGTYTCDPSTIDVLPDSVSLRQMAGPDPVDIMLFAMSRGDFAAIPSKLQQGRPTSFWYERTLTPILNIWPTPDGNQPYWLIYWRHRQIQDADFSMGQQLDVPYRFLEAFAADLAAHLAMKWAPPQRAVALAAYAQTKWAEASDEDREKVSTFITPDFSGYFD